MTFSRKKIIVKPAFQLRLALTLFLYIIIYSIILGFIIFYPLYSELSATKEIEEQVRISAIVLFLHKRIWLGLFIVAVLGGIHTIISSHRVAGPMYRFEKAVKGLIDGNYGQRIKIRKRDEFKEMETLLNGLSEALLLNRNRDAQFYDDIKNRLETISAMLDAEGAHYPEDVKMLIRSIVNEVNSRGR
ncbi:MAG: hypothetical protein HY954_00350 [Deltaproteobacteria bacterium]|nr:hypothetical protein [Deltaproteobacteria bacterium]